jgi:hypothetical protein
MVRRLLGVCALVFAVVASAMGAATAAPARPMPGSSAGSAPRTVVGHVRPVTATGVLRHGYRITDRRAHASCEAGSEATGDAYRCFSGNFVIDPCWVMKQKHFVACLSDAWSHKVIRLHVTGGYDNTGFGKLTPASYPWAVRELNGTRCSWLQGATGAVHGKRINYGCTRKTYLIGNVHRSSALWTIARGRSTTGGRVKETGTARLTKAWFGKPSLKG